MQPEERIRTLESFSNIKIKQSDFLLKNLEKISANLNHYKFYYTQIFNSLFKLGFDDKEAIPHIMKYHKEIAEGDYLDIISFLKYFPVLEAENEAEVLEETFKMLVFDEKF